MNIYGQGPLTAEVAFVGDHSLVQDLKTGMPFSGRDGENLKNRLSLLGKSPNSYYWTYFIKDRLDANKVITFKKVQRHSEATPTDLFTEYELKLFEELRGLPNLKVIFAIGEIAMFALCRQQEILKRRGSIYDYVDNPEIKVVPLIHPKQWVINYINGQKEFGNYIYSQYTYFDMKKVFDVLDKDERLEVPQYDLILKPSFDQVIDYLKKCMFQDIVAFDIETDMKLHIITCISFACTDGTAISIPFKDKEQNYFMKHHEIEIWKWINKVLKNEGVKKVGQNIIFDATYIWHLYGIETCNMEDTMVGFKILFPDFSVSLATISSICTKQPYYKDTGKEHIRYSTIDLSFWEYNALDSLVTLESWFVIKQSLQMRELWSTYEKQRNLLKPLIYMGERGMLVDVDNLHKYSETLHNEIDSFQKELDTLFKEAYEKHYKKPSPDGSLNVNSPKQLMEYFYIIKGYQPYKSKSGSITCDKNALKRLVRKGCQEANLVQEIRERKHMLSTYAECKIDSDNRFRYVYKPVGTTSGRLSSQGTFFGTGTNAQNLPPEYKKYLIADTDDILYNMDLSKAENRVVAYIAPDANMIQAFEENIDLHSLTGSLISGLTLEEVILQHKNNITCSIADGSKTWRDWGKRANHGLNYGLGYKTFAFMYEMPEKDAKYIIDKYYKAYPGLTKYHAWVKQALLYNRTLTNCLGRKRTFYDFFDHSLIKEAFSFIPQSTVADIINQRGINFIWENRKNFEGLQLRMQVHDSIVFSINKHIGIEKHIQYLKLIKTSLESPIIWKNRTFYIPVDCEFGLALKPMQSLDLTLSATELIKILKTV